MQRSRCNFAESSDQTLTVDCPNLVQDDVPPAPAERARDAKWVPMPARGQRGDDERPQMSIELVGRHIDTRPRLPDLAAPRRIQIDQEHLAAMNLVSGYHRHSFSSKRVGRG